MHWLYLLVAFALFVGAYKASGWWVLLLLVGSLVAFVAWMLGLISARISRGARSEMQILSPEELQHLREQAAARKAASAAKSDSPQP
jgi:hypothetical protein